MSEWRYIECDMCGAKSTPRLYPVLNYRLEGWTYKSDTNPAIMGMDYCPTCSVVEDEPEQPDTFVYYALDDSPEWTI